MRPRFALCAALATAALAALVLACAALAPPPASAVILRGIDDWELPYVTPEQRAVHLDEIVNQLGAKVVRVDCLWPNAEPQQGIYSDDGYLGAVVTAVNDAHAAGLQVIVTVNLVPKWASDSSYWTQPAPNGGTGYRSFYPMTKVALTDFGAFAAHLATALQGEVLGYEPYNEPNLWTDFFPQRTKSDSRFAARTYLKYLKAFGQGVKAADPGALVIAGATAPTGEDNDWRTSPQTFAAQLKALGAAAAFDVYSHHPYTVGGQQDMSPTSPPSHPSRTVSMSNLDTLLRVFPDKPFYLTEYGYSTSYSVAFGGSVTETQQAAYLRKAYALAARHPQVKMLLWYLLKDVSSNGTTTDKFGWYLGLRRVDDSRKPAWFAFARGNHITSTAPTHAARGASVRLSGRYTCASIGGVPGTRLVVERKIGTAPWRSVKAVVTGADGAYATRVAVTCTQRYRVVFVGVVASAGRRVVTP